MGLGIGFAFASMANLIVEAVDRTKTSVATAMNTIMRTIGGSLGGQITASVVAGNVIAGTSLPAGRASPSPSRSRRSASGRPSWPR